MLILIHLLADLVPASSLSLLSLGGTAALAFCTDIKDLAEDMNHHPSLHITHYRRVTIELSSHVVGKLTHFDLELAAEIDGLEYNPPE